MPLSVEHWRGEQEVIGMMRETVGLYEEMGILGDKFM